MIVSIPDCSNVLELTGPDRMMGQSYQDRLGRTERQMATVASHIVS